ncbi:MAG: aldehyde dehydrogenase family protein [Steroidobacteraceae bacterium]
MSSHAEVEAFLSRKHGHLIDGTWLTAGERIEVVNPATGKSIASVAAGTAEDVDMAVQAARRAFEHASWSACSPSQRSRWLWSIADLIESHAEELAELEYLDNGKSRSVILKGDIPAAADVFRYFAGWATKIYGQTLAVSRPGTLHAYTVKEPVGVAGLITPWNFPLLMAVWKLAPALAAGCACVLKPAEETPLTALRLAELVHEAGVPAGVVNVVTGYGHVAGAALAAHPAVDKVAFTGSTEVGKLILRAAAGNLKKLSLELGGKSPTIIFPDAKLPAAKQAAAMGIFFNAGQVCAAGSRLFVHRTVFDEVVDSVIASARAIRVAPGDDPQGQMGPLISAKHLQRVQGYVASGREEGARVAVGGQRLERAGYFFQPTVLLDTRREMRVTAEEIFGPVLVCGQFEDLDEVARQANDSIYGLSASVWTQDLNIAHTLARKLQAGSIRINTGGGLDPNLPFGGYKQSGWGREFGEEGLALYLQTKSVLIGA